MVGSVLIHTFSYSWFLQVNRVDWTLCWVIFVVAPRWWMGHKINWSSTFLAHSDNTRASPSVSVRPHKKNSALANRIFVKLQFGILYSTVSFYDGSFYDDSLLRPLSIQTEHSRLVAHHCRNSSLISVLSVLLGLFRCTCVPSFTILVQFF